MSVRKDYETINIPSVEDNVFLDTWLFRPSGAPPYPLVIAGHGMTVIKDAGLASFGNKWATNAGFASLIFDYRFFGDSGGEPRNLVDLDKQLQDFKAVLKWARSRHDLFINDKIVLMGSAIAGLSVSRLAVEDAGLAGVMAHSPVLDGYATINAGPFKPRLVFWAIVDTIRSKLGLSPLFIRAVGRTNEFAFLNTPSVYPGFTSMFEQGKTPFSAAPNLMAPRFAFQFMKARPGLDLPKALCPVLLVVAKEDDMIPSRIGRSIAEKAPDKITFVESPGGHFDIMEGGQAFDINIAAQTKFLQSVLKNNRQ